jgi:hypothetical protein
MTTKGFESPKTTTITAILICIALLFFPASVYADSDSGTPVDSPAVEGDVSPGTADYGSPDSTSGASEYSTGSTPIDNSLSSQDSGSDGYFDQSPSVDTDSKPAADDGLSGGEALPAANSPATEDYPGPEASDSSDQENVSGSPAEEDPDMQTPEEIQDQPDQADQQEEASGGNSYKATITPSAVVSGGDDTDYTGLQGGETGEFTVTFTEVGKQELGSARVEIPDQFTVSGFSTEWSTDGVTTEEGKQWQARLEENGSVYLYLRALNQSNYLLYGESVAVSFIATAPTELGVYQFETAAWTDNSAADSGSNTNHMASGYTDPVVIVGEGVGNAESFDNVRDDLNGHYVLTADIDLADSVTYSDDWEPLGPTANTPFSGSLHGNGYTISNMQINTMNIDSTYTSGFGLFGYLNNAWLVNLELVDFIIDIDSFDYASTDWAVGGLSGHSVNSHIIDCDVSGLISFAVDSPEADSLNFFNIGGLLGSMNGGTVSGSSANGIDIFISFSDGGLDYKGVYSIGGLVGISESLAEITTSFANGEIRIDANLDDGYFEAYALGGLVGYSEGKITDSYADMLLNFYLGGSSNPVDIMFYGIGGLTGHNLSSGENSRCYAAGEIIITIDDLPGDEAFEVIAIGGLAGDNEGLIEESFSTADLYIYIMGGNSDTWVDFYWIGGLVGYNTGYVLDSYTSGAITCDADTDSEVWFYEIGGLVGNNYDNPAASGGSIENSYAAGSIELSWTSSSLVEDVGGLVGLDEGTTTNSFYDSQTYDLVYSEYWPLWNSGVYDPATDPAADQRKTTAELQVYDTFNSAGWLITGQGGAYPLLWWQDNSDPVYVWYLPDTGNVPDMIGIPHGHNTGVTLLTHPGYIQPWRHPYPVSYRRALPQTGGDNSLLSAFLLLALVGTSLHLLIRFRNELNQ